MHYSKKVSFKKAQKQLADMELEAAEDQQKKLQKDHLVNGMILENIDTAAYDSPYGVVIKMAVNM